MSKYRCLLCGFTYDEKEGYPELNIPAGTKWEDLPEDFHCPICGAAKSDFELVEEEVVETILPQQNEAKYKTYRCSLCGFEYSEKEGYPELNIPAGTRWEDLPDDFHCPLCGADKADFYLVEEETEKVLEKEPEVILPKKDGKYSKYVCALCGYVYDEQEGCPELNIPAGTKWEDLPDDFHCPNCGAEKSEFYKLEEEEETVETDEDLKEVNSLELSVICSNLGRGYEKQYKEDKAKKYYELAEYFKKKAKKEKGNMKDVAELVNGDIDLLKAASDISTENKDRGALRSIVWAEKVSKIISSLVARYNRGENFDNLNVYVCTICGFVYVGDNLPEVCPVCKVPNFKFEKIK